VVSKASTFFRLIKRDEELIKLYSLMESGIYSVVNPKDMIKELTGLHSTKSTSSMSFDKIHANPAKILSNMILKNQGSRSRAVSIKMECYEVVNLLQKHIDTATKYIRSSYSQQIAFEFKTAKDKDAAVDQVLKDFHRLAKDLDSVLWIADRVIEDLDKAGWSIKNIIDLFNLQAKRE